MNHVTLIGRLCNDPDVRHTQSGMCVASYTLAVDRPANKDGQREADFIRCVAWDKRGEFAQMYLHKGMKIAVEGSIRTGSYKDKDGKTVYTTDVLVQSHEFCEKREQSSAQPTPPPAQPSAVGEGFLDIPMDADSDALPFN